MGAVRWRLKSPAHDCLLNHSFRRRSRKHQSSASLVFVRGIHRWPHKWSVTRKRFLLDDVIMMVVTAIKHSHRRGYVCILQINLCRLALFLSPADGISKCILTEHVLICTYLSLGREKQWSVKCFAQWHNDLPTHRQGIKTHGSWSRIQRSLDQLATNDNRVCFAWALFLYWFGYFCRPYEFYRP